MPVLSIIIPTYNAEKYLKETINCIINQTFQEWELIIVDDCSTDSTPNIINQYTLQNKKILSFKTATNSGSARIPTRVGFRASLCQYVSCIGQDDTLDLDYFDKMFSRIKSTNAEIACSILSPFSSEDNLYPNIPAPEFQLANVISGIEACELTLGGWQISANGMVIKKTLMPHILDENDDNYINSDEIDTRKILFEAHSVAFANTHYHYRIHSESITHKFSPKIFERLITNNQLYCFAYSNREQIHSKFIDKLATECINTLLCLENLYIRNKNTLSKEQNTKIRKIIKDAYMETKHNKINPQNLKLSLVFVSYTSFLLYCQVKYYLERNKYGI
jgi:glycosyltransferase involved in cell wall biosynthesis